MQNDWKVRYQSGAVTGVTQDMGVVHVVDYDRIILNVAVVPSHTQSIDCDVFYRGSEISGYNPVFWTHTNRIQIFIEDFSKRCGTGTGTGCDCGSLKVYGPGGPHADWCSANV
jgi:hypothetical protein